MNSFSDHFNELFKILNYPSSYCEQLEFCMLELPSSSDCDVNSWVYGCKKLFLRDLLHSNSLWRHISRSIIPLTTAKLNIKGFFSIICMDTDSPFVCSHLPNSKNSCLILHSLSTNHKHIDNCSVCLLSTLSDVKEKNLASVTSCTKTFYKIS